MCAKGLPDDPGIDRANEPSTMGAIKRLTALEWIARAKTAVIFLGEQLSRDGAELKIRQATADLASEARCLRALPRCTARPLSTASRLLRRRARVSSLRDISLAGAVSFVALADRLLPLRVIIVIIIITAAIRMWLSTTRVCRRRRWI